jgi:hypothetical protein
MDDTQTLARIRALIDKDEIRDVIYRYCRAVDRCDLELMLSCYRPDARDHHTFFIGNACSARSQSWGVDTVEYIWPPSGTASP